MTRSMQLLIVAGALSLGASACGGPKSAGDTGADEDRALTDREVSEPSSAIEEIETPDDVEPLLQSVEGKSPTTTLEVLESASVPVSRRHVDGRYLYLSVSPKIVEHKMVHHLHVEVPDGYHALAVPERDGSNELDSWLVRLRMPGPKEASADTLPFETLELTWFACKNSCGLSPPNGAAYARKTLSIQSDLAKASADGALPVRFDESAAHWLNRLADAGSGERSFYSYAAPRLLRRATQSARDLVGSGRYDPDYVELLLPLRSRSRRESRLLEMAGADRSIERGEPTVDPSSIEAFSMPARPWESIEASLPAGAGDPEGARASKSVAIESVASLAPGDALYAHFPDVRALSSAVDELDRWLGLLRFPFQPGGEAAVFERHAAQLALPLELLGADGASLHARELAIAVHEPSFVRGADLTLIVIPEDRKRLDAVLARGVESIRGEHPELERTSYEIASKERDRPYRVERLTSPDGSVRRHRAEVGGAVVLSNSREALRRVVEVAEGARPSIASRRDFRVMRRLYPHDAGDDSYAGFFFIGDGFYNGWLSPQRRVRSARRWLTYVELMTVNCAALLHGWFEGELPDDGATLVARGLLDKEDLAHAGGAKITFEPTQGASSRAGRIDTLLPVLDVELGEISAEEADSYAKFVERSLGAREVFHPLALRLTRDGGGQISELDGRVLPLNAPGLDNFFRLFEASPRLGAPSLQRGIQLAVGLGDNAPMRQLLDGILKRELNRAQIDSSGIGDWFVLGIDDQASVRDVVWLDGMLAGVGRDEREEARKASLVATSIDRFPVYVAAHIGSIDDFVTARDAFIGALDARKFALSWEPWRAYRGVQLHIGRDAAEQGRSIPSRERFTLYHATAKDIFVASPNLGTMTRYIDRILDGATVTALEEETTESAPFPASSLVGSLRSSGADSWLLRTGLGLLEWQSRPVTRFARRVHLALVRGMGDDLPAAGPARDRMALRLLGLMPRDAHGNRLTIGEKYGLPTSPVHGVEHRPKPAKIPLSPSKLTELALDIQSADAGLQAERSGDARGLRGRLRLERR
jgi:hypothetical protein